jgi:hypothetical protein
MVGGSADAFMTGLLYIQKPKPSKTPLTGAATCDRGQMIYWDNPADPHARIMAQLEKPEIMFINSSGMMVKGYEPDGVDKTGRAKYKYQEWFIAFK